MSCRVLLALLGHSGPCSAATQGFEFFVRIGGKI